MRFEPDTARWVDMQTGEGRRVAGVTLLRCSIQWITQQGCPTPDDNPAVGFAIDPFGGFHAICQAHRDRMGGEAPRWGFSDVIPEGSHPFFAGRKSHWGHYGIGGTCRHYIASRPGSLWIPGSITTPK